ncbi:MAG TPA: hypothetical protein VEU33_24660, partial [Archangium sp.]|nr:hypothetical protein [Archangium sp.]
MSALNARPPPLPWQREEWLAEALHAVERLGPPGDSSGAVALDLAPSVVLTAQGGGLSHTWVTFRPFKLFYEPLRPGPGAPFVVLNVKGGGHSRTRVLFGRFRVRLLAQPVGAA